MGVYIWMRPKGRERVTREAYKQRFLDAGLEQHFSFYREETEEMREKYRYDVLFSGGVITVYEDDDSPSGVEASARMSWGGRVEGFRALLVELRFIATRTNSDLIDPQTNKVVGVDDLDELCERIVRDQAYVGRLLGFCKPPPNGAS